MQWTVNWEIELDAANPREAVKQALAIHRDSSSLATIFRVARDPLASERLPTWYEVDATDGTTTIPREADPIRRQPDPVTFLEDTARLSTIEPWLRDGLRAIAIEFRQLHARLDAATHAELHEREVPADPIEAGL